MAALVVSASINVAAAMMFGATQIVRSSVSSLNDLGLTTSGAEGAIPKHAVIFADE